MKTKLFTLFLVLAASKGITNAAIVGGTCGDNLTWSLNTKDSTLTIEGSGAMTDWSTFSSVAWYQYLSYIKYVSLSNSVTSIGVWAFRECNSLTSIEIPNSVTSIGDYAFAYCSNLSSATIGNSVTSIGVWAFRECNSLTSIEIPNSVTSIGNGGFRECHSLTSATIGNGIISIGEYAFYRCGGLNSVSIPNSVTSIGESAFNGCSSLASIEIPNSVTSIGSSAFANCNGLTSIEIPNSVASIGPSAFYQCFNLTSVNISNSVTSIGYSAFAYCSLLNSVTIGSSVTSIGNQAFNGCGNLISITCYAPVPPENGVSSGITNTNCTLYVPSVSVETYANTLWWEDFKEIIAIPAQNPVVTFKDWDGSVLSSAEVEEGSAATPPADPIREGYTFIGWDKDFSNVTEDLVVTAQYQINRYYVQFLDWDDSVLKADSVDWNTAAVAPANPSREGYDFTGWNKEFSSITSNLVVQAQYEFGQTTNYPMTFINGRNSEEIFDEVVTIKVPAAPMIAGFTFVKWEIVSGDLADGFVIQAVYKSDTPTSAPAVYTNPANPAQKLIRNGSVYILTEDKTYTITGQAVK